jgi:hypothetical protein
MTTRRRPGRWIAAGIVAFGTAFGLAAGAAAASAGTASSQYGYYSVDGVDYKNWAAVTTITSTHQAYAVTLVSPTNKAIGDSWAGAEPRIYKNGALVCEAGYTYNSGTLAKNAVLNPSGCSYNSAATWHSQGATRGWNGSAYDSYWTFVSPDQAS